MTSKVTMMLHHPMHIIPFTYRGTSSQSQKKAPAEQTFQSSVSIVNETLYATIIKFKKNYDTRIIHILIFPFNYRETLTQGQKKAPLTEDTFQLSVSILNRNMNVTMNLFKINYTHPIRTSFVMI